MITCLYKKTFLKDLVKLPSYYREQVEKLVFEEVPKLNDISEIQNRKKMKGYQGYYRIRIGDYRVGYKVEEEDRVIFYRVKSRSDIYRVFP